MSDRPKFTPCELPRITWGNKSAPDYKNYPRCEACGIPGAVDVTDRVCLDCWKILRVVWMALAEAFKDRGRLTYVPSPPPGKGPVTVARKRITAGFTDRRIKGKREPRPSRERHAYFEDVRRHGLMSRGEEAEVAARYAATGDRRLFDRLVTANLRLVVTIANECVRPGISRDDLIQEGNLGLMGAVEKFDPARGVKLATYASWWIRAFMYRFIMANARMVKLGTTRAQRVAFYALRKTTARLEKAAGGVVTDAEIARELGLPADQVADIRVRMGRYDVSLSGHATVANETARESLVDRLAAPDSWRPDFDPEGDFDGARVREELAHIRCSLGDRDRDIFDSRLLAEVPDTLDAIGKRWSISRERTRQLDERLRKEIRERLALAMPELEAA